MNGTRAPVFVPNRGEPGEPPPLERVPPGRAYPMKPRTLHGTPGINLRAKRIRGPRWKHVCRLDDVEALHDLKTDPDEVPNLAARASHRDELHAQRKKRIEKRVEAETARPHQDDLEA